jgi:hypothetical protein
MKQGVFFLTIAALVALLAPVANVSAQADPMSVLQHFVDARNEADEAGVMTLVADDVSIIDGSACLVENQCVGRQALRAHVQLFVADKTQTLLIPPVSVSDATITVRAETSSASIRAAGVDRIVSEYTADIHDGRLTSLRVVQDASDRQTAEFQAFRRARPTHSMVVPEPDRARSGGQVSFGPPVHDDWAITGSTRPIPRFSPPVDPDWAVTRSTRPVPMFSPPVHDDWALESRP